jgi:hypothetical protein
MEILKNLTAAIAAILGASIALFAQYFIYKLNSQKDRKNKLNEVYGSIIQCLSLLEDINYYSSIAYLMFEYYKKMEAITSQLEIKRENEASKSYMTFHLEQINHNRNLAMNEKSNLKKYFYFLNNIVEIRAHEKTLKKILEYRIGQEFSFLSNIMTIEDLYSLDMMQIQNEIRYKERNEFMPLNTSFCESILKTIKPYLL